jgi:hypothetical protein
VIRIEIDEPKLARARIAISPLAEVATSVFLLRRNAPDAIPWPYDGWARRTREILRRRPELAANLYYFRPAASSPDFFIALPGWMAAIGDWLPITHAAAAARQLAAGLGLTEVAPLLLKELLVAAVYAVVAAVLLRIFEAESRRTASLDTL